ncbi:hypothetical protein COB55_06075 [Candidatus Wolfebacteria bacterium]|nr:MAG: hypothetical protein COB55_06075 [Candidatus Wolfebacteria bacterium]
MEHLITSLVQAGLNQKEAKVYIALLQLGKNSAYAISLKSGLKKPTTYVILDDLMKKGLVLKIPRAKKQQFIAKPPEEFFAAAEERLRTAKQALPELQSITRDRESATKVLLFEGMNGMREALFYRMDELKNSKDIGFWARGEGLSGDYLDLATEWNTKREKNNISLNGITPDTPFIRKWITDNSLKHGMHLVPLEDYSSQVSLDITDKFVRIADAHSMQAIIIENEKVAGMFKQIFNIVMEKYKNPSTISPQ